MTSPWLAAAEEMPAQKYEFVPPGDTFRGVGCPERSVEEIFSAASDVLRAALRG